MKKGAGIVLLLLVCILFLDGCTLQEEYDESGRRKDTFIPLKRPNMFTLNFHDLYDQIFAKIKAEDNKVADPTMNILFTPGGEIMHVDCSVHALMESSDSEDQYTMRLYRIRNNHETEFNNKQSLPEAFSAPSSTMTGIDVYRESGGYYDGRDMDMLNFQKFPKFIEWFANFNLKSVLEQYTVGRPVRFQLLSGPITGEVVKNPDVHVTYLDCSPNDIREMDKPKSYPVSRYLEFTDKDYYAVIPYYVQDGTIKGFNEMKLGQTEKITYIANNVILLIVDKTTKG
ncbi:hypothetical protein ABNB59_08430 [Paenibacillus larvae]|uniref:Uncharacterized protein n=7 Tax=Paenibacillus larvae TaxID=1464 RepID=A0A6C0QYT4_9BACL|nr:hypothetical protein [Paenibacillus larvae]ETK28774.1 hypothetical protein ERIC1_1c22440 [Paenibacillus larvae subsp. larvae DSM 25719]AQR78459.1 hypothetical protein BXP28_15265 [Paenibacillus larvae subsp. larvae]AVF20295.1 hypothetical protein ERICI_00342 [Paenibacillus larvae subsp. larvae]MCY7490593.1 hypothetical protein [Paenibacillus larvae]MCY9567949.1 hypothetical protein [Paenibacillus larvae]